jgi:spermidine/putrescine transport system substrate-binding protein
MKIRIVTIIFALLCSVNIFAAANVLNIYIWADYLPRDVVEQFTKETGIKVVVTEFDNNETLYTKLKTAPYAGYDIVAPSTYYVERMARQNMLYKMDLTKLSNFKNLNPDLVHRNFDPQNEYSIPYLWGTNGIAVNKKYFDPNKIKIWADLWQPQYRDQLLLTDEMRDTFAVALIKLGFSVNETNPEHIKQAYLELKKLMPNVKLFNSDAVANIYIDEDVVIGMGWSGDIDLARQENDNLVFIYPSDRFPVWIDCLSIAKNAPHVENSYKFLNFIMRPDIAKAIALYTGYSTPNLAAVKLMPKEWREDQIVNPSSEIMKRGEFQKDIGDAAPIYAEYWELLKIGD